MNIRVNKTEKVIFLHIKPCSGGREEYVGLDHCMRILWWTDGGRFFRRGFDNRVVEYWRGNNGDRNVRFSRKVDLDEAGERLKKLVDVISLEKSSSLPAIKWQGMVNDSKIFQSLYAGGGVPILPPDQYMSVVLQAAVGCQWNKCGFCSFYKGWKYRVKSIDEFTTHVNAVKRYFGDSLLLRSGIFMGDADILGIPWDILERMLDIVIEKFDLDVRQEQWIYGFADAAGSLYKNTDQFRALKKYKVKRLYYGLETGSEILRAHLGKPGSVEDVRASITSAKSAGLNVGVMILLGAGGTEWSERHTVNTVDVLNALPLSAGDIVYLSELSCSSGTHYTNLGIEDIELQRQKIITGYKRRESNFPVIATYDVDGFIY